MKKYLFFAAALVALASCSNEDFVGDTSPTNVGDGAEVIALGGGFKAVTRADMVGAEAAALLGENFVVYGAKNTNTTADGKFADTKVFDHYNVNFTENTAGKTASNTSDWEYVNQTKHDHATTSIQTIKYWDFGTAEYDFIAYSSGTATEVSSGSATAGKLVVSAIDPANATTSAYTVEGASAADLAKFYIADIKTMLNTNYNQEVVFNFRSLSTKVRIGLYETIPGYSVRDVKFYSAESTVGSGNPYLYGGATAFNEKGTYTVKYPTIGYANYVNSDYNKAHVSFDAAASEGQSSVKTFGALTGFVGSDRYEAEVTEYLGRAANNASITPYLTVLPNEDGVILNMKCDYTLVAIDGSGETIKVTGASAQVPTIYAKWLPNYAYTYLFKISDKTNGTTGTPSTHAAGLYPITFDATVIDSEVNKQETITIVETPSITTYQKESQGNNEYVAGTIYVMVQNGATLANDLDTKGQLYTVNTAGMNTNTVLSETAVAEALNIGATRVGTTTTGRNGIALTTASSDANITTIVGPDGNNIDVTAKTAASFTAATGTYAYVYTVSDADDTFLTTAVKVAADAVGDPNGYYTDMACTVPAEITSPATHLDAGTYYQKVTNKNTTYAVKIITVQ